LAALKSKRIAESPKSDPLCEDPVDEIAQQLDNVKDPELFLTYILWLAGRDVDKAMTVSIPPWSGKTNLTTSQILLAQNPKTGVKLDDTALIDDLRKVSDEAANRYLEHVVVIKRSPNRMLHEQLLSNLFDAVTDAVQDDGVKYHLEELGLCSVLPLLNLPPDAIQTLSIACWKAPSHIASSSRISRQIRRSSISA